MLSVFNSLKKHLSAGVHSLFDSVKEVYFRYSVFGRLGCCLLLVLLFYSMAFLPVLDFFSIPSWLYVHFKFFGGYIGVVGIASFLIELVYMFFTDKERFIKAFKAIDWVYAFSIGFSYFICFVSFAWYCVFLDFDTDSDLLPVLFLLTSLFAFLFLNSRLVPRSFVNRSCVRFLLFKRRFHFLFLLLAVLSSVLFFAFDFPYILFAFAVLLFAVSFFEFYLYDWFTLFCSLFVFCSCVFFFVRNLGVL